MPQGRGKRPAAKKKSRQRKKRGGDGPVGHIQQNINFRFGRAVSLKRVESKMTQGELAERVPLNRSHLSELENGKRSPSLELAERIAKALRCELSELLK